MGKSLVSCIVPMYNSQRTICECLQSIVKIDHSPLEVLIVDDVIFSGKTMFNALSTICYSNEPTKIEILTLVDRGHRMYPILSELTGISVPTKFGEHIEVILDQGKLNEVVLFKNS